MAQTLASDMVQKSLAVFADRAERQHRFSTEEARELLAGCPILLLSLEKLWDLAQGFLDRGMEGKQLTILLKECVDILDRGIQAFVKASERVNAADLSTIEKTEGNLLLDGSRLRAQKWCHQLSNLVHRLEALPREADSAMLPGGRRNQEASGYIGLDELTARLIPQNKP